MKAEEAKMKEAEEQKKQIEEKMKKMKVLYVKIIQSRFDPNSMHIINCINKGRTRS